MSLLSAFYVATLPTVAVEFSAARVSVVSIEMRAGSPVVSALASEPLAEGALVPSLTATNIHDRPAVVAALGRAFDRAGGRPRRVGVILADATARVSIVRFDQVPAKAADLDQLVRWQVKKTAPFPLEDAQVSYVPGFQGPDGYEFIVSIAKRDIVQEYESVCLELGSHPGVVDLATFGLLNTVLASGVPEGDWLLLHVSGEAASIAIMRGAHLIFFRNRVDQAEGPLPDLVHQTAMYYEDRLKGTGFKKVVLAGLAGVSSRGASPDGGSTAPVNDAVLDRALQPAKDAASGGFLVDLLLRHAAASGVQGAEDLRQNLESRLTTPVEALDPRSIVKLSDRVAASPRVLSALAPLVGLLLRGQEAA